MLKILIINTSGLNFEGISVSIVSLLESMDRSGMQFDFALVAQDCHPEMIARLNAVECGIKVLPDRSKNTIRYVWKLTRLIKAKRYDIVHAHGSSATLALEMMAAKWAGCKIRIAHSRNTVTNYPLLDKLLRPIFNRTYTHGFACGREAGKWLFGSRPFRVIANGKNLAKLAFDAGKRLEMRNKLDAAGKVLIGHAGGFNYQKNHDFLIKVFKELADDDRYAFYLMGDGELRPQIELRIAEYGLKEKVVFTGRISNMDEMLQAMDIMVLPSRFEGLPNVVLEWQTAGLPSLVSSTVTHECCVTNLVSFLSLQEGPAAWAEKIRSQPISNRQESAQGITEQMRTAGFDIKENARQMKEIYYELPLQRGRTEGQENIALNSPVIFISNEVANGGAGRVISVLADSLAAKGHSVQIYAYHHNQENYPLSPLVKQLYPEPGCRLKFLAKLNRILQLRRLMKRNPGAVIIAFEYFVNMQTILAGLGLKNRIIISERNDPAQQDKRSLIKPLRNLLYRLADGLVCQTPEARCYFGKAIRKKTVVIANPVMDGLPAPHSGERKKVIVSFGRLEKQKNLPLLIDAFHLLHQDYPDYSLALYGNGSVKQQLKDYILSKDLSHCIYLHEAVRDIHARIGDCAMYVSSSDYEGLSNSLLEAMALGLPCIATDCPCGGARMMIRPFENGILVPVGDVDALYHAMKYVIENPGEAGHLSNNAANVRQELAADSITAEWERLFSANHERNQA